MGLAADEAFDLGAGDDRMQVVRAVGTGTPCGLYDPIAFGGFDVTVHGRGGNDVLVGGLGPTFLHGDDGDDHVTVHAADGAADGGDGNDCVAGAVKGTLVGGAGDDCLGFTGSGGGGGNAGGYEWYLYCGPGVDGYVPAAGTTPDACEVVVSTCGCLTF